MANNGAINMSTLYYNVIIILFIILVICALYIIRCLNNKITLAYNKKQVIKAIQINI